MVRPCYRASRSKKPPEEEEDMKPSRAIRKIFHGWFKRSGDQDYEDWPQWHGFRAGYRAGLRAARIATRPTRRDRLNLQRTTSTSFGSISANDLGLLSVLSRFKRQIEESEMRQTRHSGWRLTAARREAQHRNWKIYLLRGWLALSKLYNFRIVARAIDVELDKLGA